MRQTLIILLGIIFSHAYSQTPERIELGIKDSSSLYFSKEPLEDLFYYQVVPEQKPVACIVVVPGGGQQVQEVIEQTDIHKKAFENNILTIIPSINWGTIDRKIETEILDSIFKRVISTHDVPKDKFILGGLSNGGMVSLTYTEKSRKDSTSTFITPLATFGVDPPIDLKHLYEYCDREIQRGINPNGIAEAKWIKQYYLDFFKGSPSDVPEKYINHSIYSYGIEKGGNAQYLKNVPLKFYTDLDIEHLIDNRHRDLYDWNGTDIVALVNELKMQGNQDVEVVITMKKGIQEDGTRHPHSWAILDTDELMKWIVGLIEKKHNKVYSK